MKAEMSTQCSAPATTFHDGRGLLDANRVAERIRDRWRNGETPDVMAVLDGHPELRGCRTIVLDLAYQEYVFRLQRGEDVNAEAFSQRFPSLQRSLHLFIAVHDLVSRDPEYEAESTLSWPEAGSQFLQFDLIAEIGRGSFGRVFLATEPALGGRPVVVKVAPQGGEEAEVLARLQHPNIVPIYSLQKDEAGLTAFCMPYLGRATLCDLLDYAFVDSHPPRCASIILDAIASANDRADFSEFPNPDPVLRNGCYVNGVIHLAVQLADALAHSHGRGICHRDLKPSNVLLAPDGRPFVLDFNLSVDQDALTAKIGGTLPYMAPEELAALSERSQDARQRHYDPRSDVFSLGVMVYELLTGTLPFGEIPSDKTLDGLALRLRQQQEQGPRPVRQHNNHVDIRLARLVESCLAFEPDRRPETARELANALSRELTLVRRSRRWVGNHRKLAVGTVMTMLALFVAVALFLGLRPPYSVRQLQRGMAYYEQGQYAMAVDCLTDSIRADPDSREALFARGRAYQRLGEFQMAYEDFNPSDGMPITPDMYADRGYCLNRLGSHKAAIAAYQSALNDGCRSPALLHNNIGFSYFMLRQFDDAEKHFQKAILIDGSLQAPHYNMLMLVSRRATDGHPIPETAFIHAAKAIEIGPRTADLHRGIAGFYAIAAKHDPAFIPLAIDQVGKAVDLGADPKTLQLDVRHDVLRKEAAFQDALKRPALASNPEKVTQLLDPLDNL